MHTSTTRIRRFKRGDREVLRYTERLFADGELEDIRAFYASLAENCLAFCEEKLFPELCSSEDATPQKYCYDFCCERAGSGDGRVYIRLEIKLYFSRASVIKSFSETHIWDTRSCTMISK